MERYAADVPVDGRNPGQRLGARLLAYGRSGSHFRKRAAAGQDRRHYRRTEGRPHRIAHRIGRLQLLGTEITADR